MASLTAPQANTHAPVSKTNLLALTLSVVIGLAYLGLDGWAHEELALPAPAVHVQLTATAPAQGEETAVFSGGSFWGLQAVFQHTVGVTRVVAGYTGGAAADASSARVGSGTTGHVEAVQIHYDPRQISYAQLLQVFFSVAHNPTERGRNGTVASPQYRSAIFHQSPAQWAAAQGYMAQLQGAGVFSSRILTQLQPAQTFYPADPFHQNYVMRHPSDGHVARYEAPKVARLQSLLPALYRQRPVTQ